MPAIQIIEREGGRRVVATGEDHSVIGDFVGFVFLKNLVRQLRSEGEIIFGGNQKMGAIATFETMDMIPGADRSPTMA
jgi:hypothetical protein